MSNPNKPSAPPTLTLVEKLYAVHNINTLVTEKLDLAESNYSTWSYFFKGHCSNFGVLKHIEGSSTHSSTSIPPMYDWIIADSIVKSWIFLTLSSTLRKRLIKANPKTAKDAWETIEAIFEDNKRTRVVSLKGELPKTTLTYAINGLSDKYGSLAQIIAHKEPFPDLFTVRSMVFTEEMRIQNKSPSLSVSTNSSAPQVLLTETPHCVQDTGTNKERGTRSNSSQNNTRTTTSNMHTGIGFGNRGLDLAAQQQLLSLLQAQNTLLAQYGLSTISIPRTPIGFNNSGQRIIPAQPLVQQQLMTHGLTPNQQALFTNAVQNTGNTSSNTGQEMVLPIAFNTMTLQDPANANWHMDTGASSHLNSCAHNLSTIFNSRMYPSVLVGDWKSIPVTNTGHSTLPTPSPPLHLNNVLVTPNIVKILICVCQFVRENKCTIKFDEFGFSVKDFRTCQILLRCDSTGDLYPVLVPRPPDVNIVRSLWLFRHKHNADGSLNRYKARLMANDSTQIAGIDVDETFSPVVKPATIRTVLSLAISRHWPVHQLDVKNAFLHGSLSETVYMHQPPGFRDPRHPDHVCLLQRSLYGLKQAPRAWFQRFAAYAARVGFLHSRCDSSLFIYRLGSDTAYLLSYVDDIVLTASSTALLQRIIASLHAEFSMTDLGPLNYFLGVSVTRNTSGMFLSQ
ncbi:ribonuclease H-like domain-containing protein [Tanacetum coccineum]